MKFTQAVVVQKPTFFTFANKLIKSRRYEFKFIGGTHYQNENNKAIIDFQRMNEQNNS